MDVGIWCENISTKQININIVSMDERLFYGTEISVNDLAENFILSLPVESRFQCNIGTTNLYGAARRHILFTI